MGIGCRCGFESSCGLDLCLEMGKKLFFNMMYCKIKSEMRVVL